MGERRSRVVGGIVLGAALIALGVHAARYFPFLCDDALISLRYAKRLIEGQGLTWSPGERVEGYSNLLWVLATAALGALGMDLITSVRVLGLLGMAASIAAVVRAGAPATLREAVFVGLAVLFLPLSGPLAVWSIGGMEQPLVAALLGWGVVLCYPLLDPAPVPLRAVLAPGLCMGLLCLTRPDSPLFVAVAAAAVLVAGGARGDGLRRAAGLLALPLALFLLQLAFRLAYYGQWVPNTALVKLDPSARHALDGLRYVWGGTRSLLPLILLAAASVAVSLVRNFERRRTIFLTALVLSWTAYLVVIGGDIFPAWRHFVPLVALLGLIAVIGARWVGSVAGSWTSRATGAVAVALLAVFAVVQVRDATNADAVAERWEWDGRVIGRLFKRAFGDRQALLAVDAAGALPYWSELPAIDMLGLNDFYLPRHRPTDGKRIGIGHDLGDGGYVLDRAPDLVVFGIATGGEDGFFRSAREMQEAPRFWRDYTLAVLEGRDPYPARVKVWVRRNSERIGVTRSAGVIDVPAFLLSGRDGPAAHLGARGGLVVPVSGAEPGVLDDFPLDAGRWLIRTEPSTAPLRVRVWTRPPNGSPAAPELLLDAPLPAALDLVGSEPRAIKLQIEPAGPGAIELERLTLTREPGRS